MVRHTGEPFEPPQAQLGKDPPLVGNLRRQHVVVGADAVARHHQDDVGIAVVRRFVQVADLPGVHVVPAGKFRMPWRPGLGGAHASAPREAGEVGEAATGAEGPPATPISPREAFSAISVRNCPPFSPIRDIPS